VIGGWFVVKYGVEILNCDDRGGGVHSSAKERKKDISQNK
jgi:hypothetical protein